MKITSNYHQSSTYFEGKTIALIVSTLALYVLAISMFSHIVGMAGATLLTLPIALATTLVGLRFNLLVGIFAFSIQYVLLTLVTPSMDDMLIIRLSGFVGSLMIGLFGIAVLKLQKSRYEQTELEKQLIHHQQIEDQLQAQENVLRQHIADRDEKIRIAESQAVSIVDHSGDGIVVTDLNCKIERANTAFAKLVNRDPLEINQLSLLSLLNADQLEAIKVGIESVKRSGQAMNAEIMIAPQPGVEHIVKLTVSLLSESKRVQYLVWTMHDVTQQRQFEHVLQTNEHIYRALFDQTNDAVFLIDLNGCHITANDRACDLLGFDLTEIMGMSFKDVVVPDQVEASIDNLQRLLDGEILPVYTRTFHKKDGREFPVEINATLVRDRDDQPLHIQSVVRDITKRQQSELALRENEERKGAILSASLDAIISIDHECRIIEYNRAAESIFGHDATHAIGQQLDQMIFSPESYQVFKLHVQPLLETEHVMSKRFQLSVRHANGTTFPVEIVVAPINLSNHKMFTLFIKDITEYEKSQEVLRQSENHTRQIKERIETILNSNNDAIIVMGVDFTFEQANPAFRRLFSYETDEVYGETLTKFVEPEFQRIVEDSKDLLVETLMPQRLEIVARRKDGMKFEADVVMSPIKNSSNNSFSGIICSIRDITEWKEMEYELRQALEKEKELNDLKSRFVSMVSHEFRTPLATIQATTDVIQHYEEKMSPEQKKTRFDKIHSQVTHMTDMLDEVLTLGRLQTQQFSYSPDKVFIDDFCKVIVDELQNLNRNSHTIEYSGVDDEVAVYADHKLLRLIIVNFLMNGIKYSSSGTTVSLILSQEDHAVAFTVQDHGIGIPVDDQARLFEPFHRATNVGNISGTGLGLAIAKQAIEAHGGTLTYETEVNVGTSFHFTIPIN